MANVQQAPHETFRGLAWTPAPERDAFRAQRIFRLFVGNQKSQRVSKTTGWMVLKPNVKGFQLPTVSTGDQGDFWLPSTILSIVIMKNMITIHQVNFSSSMGWIGISIFTNLSNLGLFEEDSRPCYAPLFFGMSRETGRWWLKTPPSKWKKCRARIGDHHPQRNTSK